MNKHLVNGSVVITQRFGNEFRTDPTNLVVAKVKLNQAGVMR
eukprot:CAMPEP_0178643962 /NCGR_PEP_ID=MMETSP0698-20121128/18028_1 /TAXON_ID=265572 /ORGANISM="Extubocellulus spinifer, Strain CCMP396" /LENGTH=41 /DNA_ID= /DNA_START= /DNA_END= /DNA_ORIENTATION=